MHASNAVNSGSVHVVTLCSAASSKHTVLRHSTAAACALTVVFNLVYLILSCCTVIHADAHAAMLERLHQHKAPLLSDMLRFNRKPIKSLFEMYTERQVRWLS